MTDKHTPTPLRYDRVYTAEKSDGMMRRIVKCVNMHDELVEALEEIREFAYTKMDDPSRYKEMKVFKEADKVLKKARGEE